ncbi:(2Fe-2S) ferredoxin domain-containing protein [Natroniella sulfidigena]|uniref:(2Fe-2S) ferredoxin domain-containing protein n=1 Tax=Natroniella sulfidigena TaxID=723921 RepID=UPI002009F0BC|nr:(2Fe-2S) ferredoxin domain-containing protein [Natroniella sulfidigena]MCK8816044.1 (2Fe-2S) ferredoxin domain-containing protein [Natroniella sulfidigena]
MKSLAELTELKEQAEKKLRVRKSSGKPQIIVGMDDCGIDAGAREILKKFLAEVNQRDLDVIVTQTECSGQCDQEPVVTVQLPEESKVTYGNVTAEKLEQIIEEHIVNGNILEDLKLDQ